MARGMATKNTKSHENETGASLCYAQLDVRFVSWLPVPVAEVARLPGWSTGSLATSATDHWPGTYEMDISCIEPQKGAHRELNHTGLRSAPAGRGCSSR